MRNAITHPRHTARRPLVIAPCHALAFSRHAQRIHSLCGRARMRARA